MNTYSKNLLKDENIQYVRLNKFLSDAGVCSRREADRLIEDGKIYVDGSLAVTGQRISKDQTVTYEGKTVSANNKMILIAFNKPAGIECTTEKNNPDNIVDFINYPERIYPVGRLDKNSVGLILLTNTGELVNKILKGSLYHEKEYLVRVDKKISRDFLRNMASGVRIFLEDGKKEVVTRPCRINKVSENEFSIILTQGLNRQIRRMCEALGYKVLYLKRIRIMNIILGNLPEGHYRSVSESELSRLLKDLKDE